MTTQQPPPVAQPAGYGPPPPGYVQYPGSPHWQYQPPGNQHSGLSAGKLILFFVVPFLIVLVIGGVVVFLLQRPPEEPICPDPTQACGIPPQPPSDAAPFRGGETWTSETLGFSFDYDPEFWQIAEEGADHVVLAIPTRAGEVAFIVLGVSAADASAESLLSERVAFLEERIVGFTEETSEDRMLLGEPIIGYVDGVGGAYTGTLNTPQGPGVEVAAAVIAATSGEYSIAVVVVTPEEVRVPAFHMADSMLNTVRWPEGTQGD